MSQKKKVTKPVDDVVTIKLKYDLDRWGDYNSPNNNERKVELPIGAWFLDLCDHDVIEIGEVMNSHIECKHTIYDLRNEKPRTIVKDARDVDYKNKNVLSISTIEHVGEGDLDLIKRIQRDADKYVITFPVGFNRDLEKRIIDADIDFFVIERSKDGLNTWKQIDSKDLSVHEYNNPYLAGNAMIVITNLNVRFEFEN